MSASRNATEVLLLIDISTSKTEETHSNIMKAFHKYKASQNYDSEALASPHKVNEIVFLPNSKIRSQSEKRSLHSFKWEKPYKLVKVSSISNYRIRNLGAFTTHCVQNMRFCYSSRTNRLKILPRTQTATIATLTQMTFN